MVISHVQDTELYGHLLGAERISWWRSPYLPSASFSWNEHGLLVEVEWREHEFLSPEVWNPHFGPGLAIGGLLEDFIESGLIQMPQETSSFSDDERAFRAGRYTLSFSRDRFADWKGSLSPEWRLSGARIRMSE